MWKGRAREVTGLGTREKWRERNVASKRNRKGVEEKVILQDLTASRNLRCFDAKITRDFYPSVNFVIL